MYRIYITGDGEGDFLDLPTILDNINALGQTIESINHVGTQWHVVIREPVKIEYRESWEGYAEGESREPLSGYKGVEEGRSPGGSYAN